MLQLLICCYLLPTAAPLLQLTLAWKAVESSAMRGLLLREGKRADGRGVSDIRPIVCRGDVLPRTHGSALFTRGETQVCRDIQVEGEGEQLLHA